MYVLGIESTCDETAASCVADGKRILSNVVHSQTAVHAPFGGVYPELASRAHMEVLIEVIDRALKQADLEKSDLDLIAVAHAPGLVGGLLVGVEAAKALSLALGIPFIGVNHVEAHLYAAMMSQEEFSWPALGVVLSGGHSIMLKMNAIGSYEVLGTTIDDALGEAFDKLAVMLGYSYPGGALIEKLALSGDPEAFKLSAGKIKDKPLYFSYSGLKTACRTLIEKEGALSESFKSDLAASFQKTVFQDLVKKIKWAAESLDIKRIYLGGGVICNSALRDYVSRSLASLECFYAPKNLCADNAAMIAGLGYHRYRLQGRGDGLGLIPITRTLEF